MLDEKKISTLAHHFSEWTDDQAPLHEEGQYKQAAAELLKKYEVILVPKERLVDSNLMKHAQVELALSGVDQDIYGDMTTNAVLELLSVFTDQGHSGASASIVTELFHQLVQFKNLKPLTDDPTEWHSVAAQSGYDLWQNKRNSACFSTDGGKTYYSVDDGSNSSNQTNIYTSTPKGE